MERPSEQKEFTSVSEKSTEDEQVAAIEKQQSTVIRVPVEDWEKLDFIKLEKWYLVHDRNTNDIALIGYRPDIEEFWLSDNVHVRIDENRIITKSKTCYHLVGMIDSASQESKTISSKFESGFPEDWKEIIVNS